MAAQVRTCSARIMDGYYAHTCGKPAKVFARERDAGGKEFGEMRHWCGLHSPEAVARRNAKRDARIDGQLSASRRRVELGEARDAVIKAAIAFVNSNSIKESATARALVRAVSRYEDAQ